MKSKQMNILLADDDIDDCIFFKAALEKLSPLAHLTTVHDGEQLMLLLSKNSNALPDVLFLDLNMPRKNGFECLAEIMGNKKLEDLKVIIFSTSLEQGIVDMLYNNGAQYFMRKPPEFSQLIKVIRQALAIILDKRNTRPDRENFVLTTESPLAV
jgi:CheY-like chemotaxis protein